MGARKCVTSVCIQGKVRVYVSSLYLFCWWTSVGLGVDERGRLGS